MKSLKKYISPIATVIILLLFGVYLFKNPQIIDEVLSTKLIYIILVMFVYLIIFFLEGLFIFVTLKIFNKMIGKKESFLLATVSRIGNYLLPMRAGAIFRATYLKKRYEFPYSNFLSAFYGYYIIFFLLSSSIALLTLCLKYFINNELFLPLILFCLIVIFGMIVLIFLRLPFKKIICEKKGIIQKVLLVLDKFVKGWDIIVKDKRNFMMLFLIAFGNILMNAVVVLIEFDAIGKVTNILNVLLYTCISSMSLLISITPGSLGIREGAFLITSKSIGLSESEIMKLAFLDRGIMFLLLIICLILILIFIKKISLRDIFFGKKQKAD